MSRRGMKQLTGPKKDWGKWRATRDRSISKPRKSHVGERLEKVNRAKSDGGKHE